MADPKCPECGIEGTAHIGVQASEAQSQAGEPWFQVAYCDGCGHVYGVFAKIVQTIQSGPTLPRRFP